MHSILIVDDQPVLLRHLARYLGSLGDVTAMPCAEDAMAALADGTRYDVMVLDLNMRPVSGEDLLIWLHDQHPEAVAHVVVNSGMAGMAQTAVRRLGMTVHVTDKARPDRLRSLVTNLLQD